MKETFDADGRTSLENERDFLLQSLDDLEAERVAGGIDDETFEALHDDYTARAAAVLRTLRDGVDSRPARARWSVKQRALVAVALVVFAVLGAWSLTHALGARPPGGTITGNNGSSATIAGSPAYRSHITKARELLGTDLVGALREYNAAAAADPTKPEPLAYEAWILTLTSRQVKDPKQHEELLSSAQLRLDRAEQLDAGYPDSFVFRGMLLLQDRDDPMHAIPALQRYLDLSSGGPFTDMVQNTLVTAQREAASMTGSTTGSTASTTTATRNATTTTKP